MFGPFELLKLSLDMMRIAFSAVLLCASLSCGSYHDAVAQDAPVVFWRFEDASSNSGEPAADAAGGVSGSTFDGDVSLVAAGIETPRRG